MVGPPRKGEHMADELSGRDLLGAGHSLRFRKMSTGYPHRVSEAYEGYIDRAAYDSDEQVAATVAAWEKANDEEVRDWVAIGESEREGDDEIDWSKIPWELRPENVALEMYPRLGKEPLT